MSSALEKKAKEIILTQMESLGEITTEAVMALVSPHYLFDPGKARNREVRRKANNLMSKFKDDQGVRNYFNYKDRSGQSKYVNVARTSDLTTLWGVEQQIEKMYRGLTQTKNKINRRRLELAGQVCLFADNNDF